MQYANPVHSERLIRFLLLLYDEACVSDLLFKPWTFEEITISLYNEE